MGWIEITIHAIFWLLGFWILWKIPLCPKLDHDTSISTKDLSIIIPARNEEESLPVLLESLKEYRTSVAEIIVVDDDSDDDTLKIAQSFGAKTVKLDDLPDGWVGKNWACFNGAKQAKGKYLVFLDADTRFKKQAMERIINCIGAYKGVVSIQPFHKIKRLYENLSLFFNIILIAGMGTFTPFQNRVRPIGAFGPCFICSREDYDKVEGHQGVKDAVMEDIAMGQKFVKKKVPVFCIGGKGVIDFRMYPKGIKDVVNGWSKGFTIGAKATSIPILIMVIAWITGSFFPLNLMISVLRSSEYIYLLVVLGFYIAYVLQLFWMSYRIGSFSFFASLFYPIAQLFFVIIFIYSLIITLLRKRVTWKERGVKT